MLSETLVDLKNTSQKDLDKEILRAAMIAELDAININRKYGCAGYK